ncbi:hypothetical protein [Vibrio anguillarum]|nr:hypothetical protein [Vibrio anguillarum]NOI05795.1 hypothetical protein [Vibrio anguillarum]
MTQYQTIAVIVGLFAVLWLFRPKGNFSKTVYGEERDSIIQLCKDDPSIIEYVALLDTFDKDVVCEVKLKNKQPVRVDSGVKATSTWLQLKA